MIENPPITSREKVYCYITRGRELLVFEHDPEFDAGIQVVGGSVDTGETLEQAAIRETFEESGLVLERPIFLGTTWRTSTLEDGTEHQHVRHYFWLEALRGTPDSWSHVVSSGEIDSGMVFYHRFVPLEEVDLVFGMGELLERLTLALTT